MPPAVKEGIEYVRSRDIPVVLASRVHTGRVVPAYSYWQRQVNGMGKIILGGINRTESQNKADAGFGTDEG